VGGNFALISLLGLCLYFYNKSSFEKALVKRYRQLISDSNEGKDIRPPLLQNEKLEPDMINKDVIRETLSFEMLMQLAIMHH